MKQIKTLLTGILISTIMISSLLFPINAKAMDTSGDCGETVKWTFADGTVTISGTGQMTDYLADSPWYQSEDVEKVIINKGVTSVGENAFEGCSNLESVTLPSTITNIGGGAFEECRKLETITIDKKAQNIGIGSGAFYACTSLKTISASISHVYSGAFSGCSGLESFEVTYDGWGV